jgi:hypothetical protein
VCIYSALRAAVTGDSDAKMPDLAEPTSMARLTSLSTKYLHSSDAARASQTRRRHQRCGECCGANTRTFVASCPRSSCRRRARTRSMAALGFEAQPQAGLHTHAHTRRLRPTATVRRRR